jgi:hypothetical protein
MNNFINKIGKGVKSLIFTYVIMVLGLKVYDKMFTFSYTTFDFILSIIIGILTLATIIHFGQLLSDKIFPKSE